MLIIDAATLVVAVLVSGYLVLTAMGDMRRGRLSLDRSLPPVTREDTPSQFWFSVTLCFVLAALFAALGVAAIGNMAGWWEARLL